MIFNPQSFQMLCIELEKQTDDLGKVLNKQYIILETYEVEGYDYPPILWVWAL